MTSFPKARRRSGAAIARIGEVATRPLSAAVLGRLDEIASRLEVIEAEQSNRISRLEQRLHDQEAMARRDLAYALDLEATRSTAAFIQAAMPTATVLPEMRDTLRFGLSIAPEEGLALEFGVAGGETLRIIADARGGTGVFGFDSFDGLPEDWRSGFSRGLFAVDTLPDVPGATLVPGLFQESLPGWLSDHREPIAFVHLDADLYSSTRCVLDLVEPRLRPDAVLVFDEFFNYPGWPEHEFRAWVEFVERTRVSFSYEAYTATHEQVVVRLGTGG
jgi:hypothetical protein